MAMNGEQLLARLETVRALLLNALEGVSGSQWTDIPQGLSNNILWNAAHVATVQGRLLYLLSGQPSPIPEDLTQLSTKGTSPRDWAQAPDPQQVLGLLRTLVPHTLQDLRAGKFAKFTPTELRPGLRVESFEDAVVFAILHEGIHTGVIMQIKKLVS